MMNAGFHHGGEECHSHVSGIRHIGRSTYHCDVIKCMYPFVYPSMGLVEDPWIRVSSEMGHRLD